MVWNKFFSFFFFICWNNQTTMFLTFDQIALKLVKLFRFLVFTVEPLVSAFYMLSCVIFSFESISDRIDVRFLVELVQLSNLVRFLKSWFKT